MPEHLPLISTIHVAESVDALVMAIDAEAIDSKNSQAYKAELTMLYSENRFKNKNTLWLDAKDIDTSGLAVLALFRNYCCDAGDERPTLELSKQEGPYIARQLVRAGMDKNFEIRYR